jgi:predicted PurR-regulated permease PerM
MNLKSKELRAGLLYITFGFFMVWILMNQAVILASLKQFLSILSPFILGLAIAFVFNAPMKAIERFLFEKPGVLIQLPKMLHRPLAYLITLILISGVVAGILLTVIPDLTKTIVDFINAVPQAVNDLEAWVMTQISLDTELGQWLESINFDFATVKASIITFAQDTVRSWFNASFNLVTGVFNTFIQLFLAFVFSIYVLMSKDRLKSQSDLIAQAYLTPKQHANVWRVTRLANDIFSSFVFGQTVEALIVGVLFFIVLTLLGFPYVLLISTIIAFFALIPVVGSMIAMTIGMILVATTDPIQALWFFVVYQVVQQLEGNFIYPYVVGKGVGLPAMWVLFAITVGGSLWGVIGILLSIPTLSLMYVLFKENVKERVALKKENAG